jgi:hypothetical protein
VEAIDNWPAHQVEQWHQFGKSIGGVTPLTAEIAVFAMMRIAMWQGTWVKDQSPLKFNDVFLPLAWQDAPEEEEDQSPDEIVSVLKAFARGQSKQNRNCDNGG